MTILEQLEHLMLLSQRILDELKAEEWQTVSDYAEQRNSDCRVLFQPLNYSELLQYPDILNSLAVLDKQILYAVDQSKIETEKLLSQTKLRKVASTAYLGHSHQASHF